MRNKKCVIYFAAKSKRASPLCFVPFACFENCGTENFYANGSDLLCFQRPDSSIPSPSNFGNVFGKSHSIIRPAAFRPVQKGE